MVYSAATMLLLPLTAIARGAAQGHISEPLVGFGARVSWLYCWSRLNQILSTAEANGTPVYRCILAART